MTDQKLRVLSARDIQAALSMPQAIEAMRSAFIELSSGKADVPLRTAIRSPGKDETFLVMSAYLGGKRQMGNPVMFTSKRSANPPWVRSTGSETSQSNSYQPFAYGLLRESATWPPPSRCAVALWLAAEDSTVIHSRRDPPITSSAGNPVWVGPAQLPQPVSQLFYCLVVGVHQCPVQVEQNGFYFCLVKHSSPCSQYNCILAEFASLNVILSARRARRI